MQSRTLYVVKTRKTVSEPVRTLTAFDRLAGWRDRNGWNADGTPALLYVYHADGREQCVSNEGHELGTLHSISGAHMLTWGPQPGDVILAAVAVDFREDRARYCPMVGGGSWCDEIYRIECRTVLGRAVMLGEDGAEDAFGDDALRQAVEAALTGDWRDQLCECELVAIEDAAELPDDVTIPAPRAAAQTN